MDTLSHVAYIHQRAGAHEQAAVLYSICLLITPEDPELLHGAGYNKMKSGDLEEALIDLGSALKLSIRKCRRSGTTTDSRSPG